MADWTPNKPFAVGDVYQAPNPLTRWDRVRMFFGFSRKSPATCDWKVVRSHKVSGDLVSYGGWKIDFRER
jgi:hypothetical protein